MLRPRVTNLGSSPASTRRFGSSVHDVIEGRAADGSWIHRTNNAGGLTGGVTNGEPLRSLREAAFIDYACEE